MWSCLSLVSQDLDFTSLVTVLQHLEILRDSRNRDKELQEVWQRRGLSYKYFHLTLVLQGKKIVDKHVPVSLTNIFIVYVENALDFILENISFSGPYANGSALKKV